MRSRVMVRAVVASLLVALVACRKSDESLAKRAGNKVGATVTEFASGVGKGVDTTMVVEVEIAPEVLGRGLSKTVAKSIGIDTSDKGFSVYLVSKQKFAGTLIAKAMTAAGRGDRSLQAGGVLRRRRREIRHLQVPARDGLRDRRPLHRSPRQLVSAPRGEDGVAAPRQRPANGHSGSSPSPAPSTWRRNTSPAGRRGPRRPSAS